MEGPSFVIEEEEVKDEEKAEVTYEDQVAAFMKAGITKCLAQIAAKYNQCTLMDEWIFLNPHTKFSNLIFTLSHLHYLHSIHYEGITYKLQQGAVPYTSQYQIHPPDPENIRYKFHWKEEKTASTWWVKVPTRINALFYRGTVKLTKCVTNYWKTIQSNTKLAVPDKDEVVMVNPTLQEFLVGIMLCRPQKWSRVNTMTKCDGVETIPNQLLEFNMYF